MRILKIKTITTALIIAILSSNTLPVFAANNKKLLGEYETIEKKYNFEDEVTTFSDLAVLSEVWKDFVKENPNSTEAEQEAFLIQYVEENGVRPIFNQSAITTYGVGDYIPGFSSLNDAERKLALQHPVQAVTVYDCSTKATNATVSYYGINGWQDNSDAFRHCTWNALMKKAMGTAAANTWATAHEAESSGIDKEMDLFNNSVGRSIAVSGKSDSEIYEAVKGKVSNGSCRRIVDGNLVATDNTGLIK